MNLFIFHIHLVFYVKELNEYLELLNSVENLNDINQTSHPLNGIKAKKMSLQFIVESRMSKFIEDLSTHLWKVEGLYYYKGEILPEVDYKNALATERAINETNKIPRTTPIKSFFESDEEYAERIK